MRVFTTQAEFAQYTCPVGQTRGFVPTMGALHEGHLSLVKQCRKECDQVVVSIFVNPTQFNDPNDLKNYPRTLETDLQMLEAAGVDAVYTPTTEDIYPEPDTRQFDFGALETVMEGARRPGHFNGVAQVVSRLFTIARAQKAYFGEKDFQQLAIIRELVRREGFPIEIIGCPTVRETDGLAMSSRNTLLTPEQRTAAPAIYAALRQGAERAGKIELQKLKAEIIAHIDHNPLLETEYFEIVNARTLAPVTDWDSQEALRGCVAVRVGAVRLIDNVDFTPCK